MEMRLIFEWHSSFQFEIKLTTKQNNNNAKDVIGGVFIMKCKGRTVPFSIFCSLLLLFSNAECVFLQKKKKKKYIFISTYNTCTYIDMYM